MMSLGLCKLSVFVVFMSVWILLLCVLRVDEAWAYGVTTAALPIYGSVFIAWSLDREREMRVLVVCTFVFMAVLLILLATWPPGTIIVIGAALPAFGKMLSDLSQPRAEDVHADTDSGVFTI